jgi:superfamily II DNA or RNA helicase
MSIDELKPIYFPNEINVDTELFLPVSSEANSIECMSGYFTSGFLAELAQSVLCFLNGNKDSIKFVISPNLSPDDLKVLIEAERSGSDVLDKLFPNYQVEIDSLKAKTLEIFFYLILSKKIELKVAVLNSALFHAKTWIFNTSKGLVTIHGSGNATSRGLSLNFEQLTLSRSWKNEDARDICNDLKDKFDQIWGNTYKGINTYPLNQKTLESIKKYTDEKTSYENSNNLIKDLQEKYDEYIDELKMQNIKAQSLKIPSYLKYTEGPYAHQGNAVDAWFENSCTGILAIATGGGKTLTSLVAASKLNDLHGNMFVVIAVPTIALLSQWAEDVIKFGVTPINSLGNSKSKLKNKINLALKNIKFGTSKCEVLIITHEALKSELMNIFDGWQEKINFMLIGDEVHNLGSEGFIESAPKFFKFKLGLSATHERQFDEIGTNFLSGYFGKAVFEYSLQEAIGNCLVPYDYYFHKVFLTATEEDDFKEVTAKIKQLSYAANRPDGDRDKSLWSMYCLKRRRIIETAENKATVFKDLFEKTRSNQKIEKTLIFCTDKNNEQITQINSYLNSISLNWHQVTSQETSNPKLLSSIVAEFKSNEYQVLTAMRVLDEGFNIPQIETAYLLSSNTVKRQWIQRLGRILRLSPETGKKKAVLHDFLVLPIVDLDKVDNDLKTLIKSECARVLFFSKLSSNFLSNQGAFEYINELVSSLEIADEYCD